MTTDTIGNAVVLAGTFQDIGNHLFGMGEGWSERALKLFLIVAVLVTIVAKMSMKAAIGSVLGLVICLGIYNARTELSNAFKDEVTKVNSPNPAGSPQSAPAPTGRLDAGVGKGVTGEWPA
ncbi:hypothetical protein [Streptomyces sp. S1]|uniref:hypothetical protein n=1 Tax=unclassified Streptomyces TaxID=2593676 RepID=UPI000EF7A89E|nr:hypothetical protein [Streptomyces sp. S1]